MSPFNLELHAVVAFTSFLRHKSFLATRGTITIAIPADRAERRCQFRSRLERKLRRLLSFRSR